MERDDEVTDSTREFISLLSEAPNDQIEQTFIDEIKAFSCNSQSECLFFLRNMLDRMVFAGACSDFVIQSITAFLCAFPPESSCVRIARRISLNAP